MGGGIARLHGELARRYPAGELIVSTPQDADAAEVDAQFGGAVDRLPIGRGRTKSLPGLLLWSRRAASLARLRGVRIVYCGNVKPAGYPARWVYERTRTPYCVFFYGADLLSERPKCHLCRLQRRASPATLGGAASLVDSSDWPRASAACGSCTAATSNRPAIQPAGCTSAPRPPTASSCTAPIS